MRFTEVTLAGPAGLPAFYRDVLGLPLDGDGIRIGETTLRFEPAGGEPFYHFALLVPGDRFDAAHAWARKKVDVLPDPGSGDEVFDFSNNAAKAFYFHDPAHNIVELNAKRGIGEKGKRGEFAAEELLGLAELGIVGDPAELLVELESLGLEVWQGSLDEPGRLLFVGDRRCTFILAPRGRGWLPLGRPADPHPIDAHVEAPRHGRVELGEGLYTVTSGPSRDAQRHATSLSESDSASARSFFRL